MVPAPNDPLGVVPRWLSWIFRVGTLLLLTGYFFFVYCNFRAMLGDFGFHISTILSAGITTLLMSAMVVFLVGVPELPTVFLGHVRARRRFARGLCPRCAYDLRGPGGACPECGAPGEEPPAYRLTAAAVRRFAWILLVAWLFGSAIGEAWMLRDEASFRAAVELVASTPQAKPSTGDLSGLDQPGWQEGFFAAPGVQVHKIRRDRAWPASHSWMIWSPEHGFAAGTPFQLPRIPGWRPTEPAETGS
ncbi:MAG: hypothetical protein KDA22_13790 [Phycisphaerales bacterium]|nr:hypothetical protein [Phycisphaerales bacterium]